MKTPFFSVFALLVLVPVISATSPRVASSDLFEGFLGSALRLSTPEGTEVPEIRFMGSGPAIAALTAGEADVAIIALPDERMPAGDFAFGPLAYQVAVVVVHDSNPVQSIRLDQLREVFGEGGSIEEWGRVGGTGTWVSRRMNTYVLRRADVLALELFRAHAMSDRPLRATTRFRENTQGLLREISEDNAAIALVPTTRMGSRTRALFIARDAQSQPFSPSADNVMIGDYPLRLPFYVVYRRDLDAERRSQILRILYSDAMAQALEENDVLPLPNRERRDRLMQAEMAR
ncbi:MAG: hypothetical protein JJT96_15195 [Opitutales bacterium]|nr:hypothetical protein [Opitutales bacterium]